MNKLKWTKIPTDEKETLMNFDYFEKVAKIYTTNQGVSKNE